MFSPIQATGPPFVATLVCKADRLHSESRPVSSSCLHNMQNWPLQKKAKLRADLQLERYESHSEQEGEDSAVACATVHVLQSPLGQTSTVTVAPFSLHSDEEPAGDADTRSAG